MIGIVIAPELWSCGGWEPRVIGVKCLLRFLLHGMPPHVVGVVCCREAFLVFFFVIYGYACGVNYAHGSEGLRCVAWIRRWVLKFLLHFYVYEHH